MNKIMSALLVVAMIAGVAWSFAFGVPMYMVWQQQKAGEAELARAEQNRQVAVLEAKAKLDSAESLAQAEVKRAEGTAKANQIIGQSLKGNEAYIHWLWVDTLKDSKDQIIYIPTEAGVPITESFRLKESKKKVNRTIMKIELFNDNFQNFKRYGIPKAQLVIADIPYNLGNNAYASNPMWYVDGDNKNGESKKAGKAFFNSDYNFNIAEYFHFCNRLLKKEPKERGQAPCMIVFCSYQQQPMVIEYAKKHGFKNYIPITFNKNYSAQVLKANMRIVGATEYALVLYREKLPKFNNNKKMIFDHFEWKRDNKNLVPNIHPTQKPISVLKRLIEIFTDEGDIVIVPVAGSGSTLRAAMELGRSAYGFEIDRRMYAKAKEEMLSDVKVQTNLMEFVK